MKRWAGEKLCRCRMPLLSHLESQFRCGQSYTPAEGQLRKGNALPKASFVEYGDTCLFQSVFSGRITIITSSKIMSKPNKPTPSRAQIWAKTPITSILVLKVGASCPTEVCKFSTSVLGPSKSWHTCSSRPHVERPVYSASHTSILPALTSGAEQDSQNALCSARSSIIFIVYSVMDGRELLFSKRLVTLSSLNYFSGFWKKVHGRIRSSWSGLRCTYACVLMIALCFRN